MSSMEVLNALLALLIFLATALAGYIVFLCWLDWKKPKYRDFNDPYLINAFICDAKKLIGSTNSNLRDEQYRNMFIWHSDQIKSILDTMDHELETILNWNK